MGNIEIIGEREKKKISHQHQYSGLLTTHVVMWWKGWQDVTNVVPKGTV